MEVIIRKANSEDALELHNIAKRTFSETFADQNSKADMDKYLSESFNIEKLTDELNNPESDFFLAYRRDRVIGYLKMNRHGSQTELKDQNSVEIERIYVLREFHGKKVAQKLYDIGLETAKHHGVEFIWLGVWEKNPRAVHFYKKNGFVEFDKHIFKLGNDEQVDIMMKLKIKYSIPG